MKVTDKPAAPPAEGPPPHAHGVTRRRLLGAAGVGAAVAGVGVAGGFALADRPTTPGPAGAVPFRGEHQAGITTPAQDRLHFVALDLTTTDRAAVIELLQRWTLAAERMTTGAEAMPGGAVDLNPHAAPTDTGEALGLPPAALTLTFGLGPGFFDKLGLTAHMPAGLAPLPAFQRDQIDPARSGGDLCIQACADDPQVAVHAIRNLARMGFGTTAVRWSQLGFGRTSSTTVTQSTPRNLFGFKDGTRNVKAEDADLLRRHVWVQPGDDPAWLTSGSYLVARRIRMHIEVWDRTSLSEQESIFGRTKGAGAPIGQGSEFEEPDLTAHAIAPDAHIRLASAQALGGVRILRRGYNFVDGTDGKGHLDAGLFFLAYMRDPHTQFVPMQRTLASQDRLKEYIQHVGSAVFAIPAGLAGGDYWGHAVFEA